MSSKIFNSAQPYAVPETYIGGINAQNFEAHALALYRYQYEGNAVYHQYCDALRKPPDKIRQLTDIPFLPVSFFKTHQVVTHCRAEASAFVFESSGTSGEVPARHFVHDGALYKASLLEGFRQAFGAPADYVILALLPSYLERPAASLVHMARVLMAEGSHMSNGFFLNDWSALRRELIELKRSGQKTILLGVTFALLDFADAYAMDLSGITVMETGGMKGRREEWTRAQVHEYLQARWNLEAVATEYGMTELLSQAYALQEGLLTPSATMRVLVRELADPLSAAERGSGALNIIDLANVHSCAFIATEDIGTVHDTGTFEVLGRMDYAMLRGCSLMTA